MGKNARHTAQKTIAEKFTDLENEMDIKTQLIQGANRQEQIRTSPWQVIPRTTEIQRNKTKGCRRETSAYLQRHNYQSNIRPLINNFKSGKHGVIQFKCADPVALFSSITFEN